jgi:uncharacterized double-CXXCG motif protein
MDYFLILPDDENWGTAFNDNIEANYMWTMPGVHCPICQQTWATLGVAYPLVDLSSTSIRNQLEKPGVVEIEVYEELKKVIKQIVPDGLPIPPGTEFGPVVGKITGPFGDFVWRQIWDPMMKVGPYANLNSTGLSIPMAIYPMLQHMVQGQLFQLQIEPYGQLSSLSFIDRDVTPCPRCKRESRKLEKVIVERDSVPDRLDMFRLRNYPTKILVSQRLRDSVEQFGLTNIKFEKVEMV